MSNILNDVSRSPRFDAVKALNASGGISASNTEAEARYVGGREDRSSFEDREYQRARTLLTGVLIVDDIIVDVLVHDISANGAWIRVKGEVPGAWVFKIRINGVGQFRAVTRWRDRNMLGVQFMEDPKRVVQNLDGRLCQILAP